MDAAVAAHIYCLVDGSIMHWSSCWVAPHTAAVLKSTITRSAVKILQAQTCLSLSVRIFSLSFSCMRHACKYTHYVYSLSLMPPIDSRILSERIVPLFANRDLHLLASAVGRILNTGRCTLATDHCESPCIHHADRFARFFSWDSAVNV